MPLWFILDLDQTGSNSEVTLNALNAGENEAGLFFSLWSIFPHKWMLQKQLLSQKLVLAFLNRPGLIPLSFCLFYFIFCSFKIQNNKPWWLGRCGGSGGLRQRRGQLANFLHLHLEGSRGESTIWRHVLNLLKSLNGGSLWNLQKFFSSFSDNVLL